MPSHSTGTMTEATTTLIIGITIPGTLKKKGAITNI